MGTVKKKSPLAAVVKLLALLAVLFVLYKFGLLDDIRHGGGNDAGAVPTSVEQTSAPSRADESRPIPAGAFHGKGIVIKLLPDDTEGLRHQRILLKLDTGKTLLVVHNTDIAPRIDTVEVGDTIEYCGEFVDNDRGGLVHWTHHDPGGRHAAGWLKHNGRIYE